MGSHRTEPSHSSQRNGPACPPPRPPSPSPPSSTSHFCLMGGCPPSSDSPCQLGSMFAMSISLPNGTVLHLPTTGFCGVWHRVPPEEAVGVLCSASLLTHVSTVSATGWVKRALPLPLREPAGEMGLLSSTLPPAPPLQLLSSWACARSRFLGPPALPCRSLRNSRGSWVGGNHQCSLSPSSPFSPSCFT